MEVFALVVSIVALIASGIALGLMTLTISSLKRQVKSLENELSALSRECDKNSKTIEQLSQVAARGSSGSETMMPLLEVFMGARKRGILPTILLLGWRGFALYSNKRRESSRFLARR